MKKARSESAENCKMRDMQLARHVRCMANIGKFLGPKDVNLRNLQSRTGTMVYGDDVRDEFMIFYNSRSPLNSVKYVMGYSNKGNLGTMVYYMLLLFGMIIIWKMMM